MSHQPGGSTFLIVEDRAQIARRLAAGIEPHGDPIIAENLKQARKAWRTLHAEIVGCVVDVRLPDGNGLDFLTVVHAMRPGLGALVMTGFPSDDVFGRALGLRAQVTTKREVWHVIGPFARRCVQDAARGPGLAAVRESGRGKLSALVRENAVALFVLRHGLTRAHAQILALEAAGSSPGEVQTLLGISHHTYDTHVTEINRRAKRYGSSIRALAIEILLEAIELLAQPARDAAEE